MNYVAENDISTPELLRYGIAREILRSPGPCITILLPPYRPGGLAGSPVVLLNSYNQVTARELANLGFPKSQLSHLLRPLEDLADSPTLMSGSHWGRAILRSPSLFEQFVLTQPAQASFNAGGSFAIRKLAVELGRPPAFYTLVLSKTNITLLRCAGLHAEVAKLPHSVPDTLAAAIMLEPPDHDLENRAAAGSGPYSMGRVRFGTGSGREREHAHLADFYKIVDRGLQELLREPETPLILAGVEADCTIYRRVSGYRYLAQECVTGSFDIPREQSQVLMRAYTILRTESIKNQHARLLTLKERTAASRFATDPLAILHGAFEGRLDSLYLNETAEQIDMYERGAYRSWGKEDLLNLAAVQTIIHHGRAYQLPAEMMPDGSIAVGVMRF